MKVTGVLLQILFKVVSVSTGFPPDFPFDLVSLALLPLPTYSTSSSDSDSLPKASTSIESFHKAPSIAPSSSFHKASSTSIPLLPLSASSSLLSLRFLSLVLEVTPMPIILSKESLSDDLKALGSSVIEGSVTIEATAGREGACWTGGNKGICQRREFSCHLFGGGDLGRWRRRLLGSQQDDAVVTLVTNLLPRRLG